jgi:hypothetical protein
MPKGFKGILTAIIVTVVAMAIINRVPALRNIVNPA